MNEVNYIILNPPEFCEAKVCVGTQPHFSLSGKLGRVAIVSKLVYTR